MNIGGQQISKYNFERVYYIHFGTHVTSILVSMKLDCIRHNTYTTE
jgi:hypothetical protein